jgi:AcrR family transcriptional regulator
MAKARKGKAARGARTHGAPARTPRALDDDASNRVLRAAMDIVELEGVARLVARRVATAADVSLGGIYILFGNLDTLKVACKKMVLGDLREHLSAAAVRGAGLGVEDRLIRLADAYVAFAEARPHAWASLFESTAEIERDAVLERTREVFLILEGILSDLPGLPADRRPVMARALWSAVHGIVYLGRRGNLGPIGVDKVPETIRALVGAVVAGLAGSAGDDGPAPG